MTEKKKSLSQQTADKLYNIIVLERQLEPGDKLPNEVELSRELKVSRTTLREALHILTSQNVLEVHRGRGTYVSPEIDRINDFGFSGLDQVKGQLRDLFELRQIFEPSAARMACQRATPEELAEILARGEAVEDCLRQGADRTQADWAFHAAIVRATHNEYMMRLLPMINQAVSAAVESGEHKDQLAEDTRRDHGLIMDFFRKRDAAGAEHAMAIHLHHSIDVMGL
jgi:DNA-binding FadR family transcriptional regulator